MLTPVAALLTSIPSVVAAMLIPVIGVLIWIPVSVALNAAAIGVPIDIKTNWRVVSNNPKAVGVFYNKAGINSVGVHVDFAVWSGAFTHTKPARCCGNVEPAGFALVCCAGVDWWGPAVWWWLNRVLPRGASNFYRDSCCKCHACNAQT